MIKSKPILIGCIIFPLILIVGFFIGFISTIGSGGNLSKTKIPSNAWLRVNPSAVISDYSEMQPIKWLGDSGNSAEDMARKIRAAAGDSRIKGMLLEPSFIQTNYPALAEIGLAIADFKKSGKPVAAYGDYFSQGDYLLATFANEIYMEPSASAGLILEGVSTNLMFYKELFDKLGIKMHILQSGEFKGAGEPYSQTSLSPGTRDNIDAVLKDRYTLLLKDIASRRKLSIEDITKVFETREDYFLHANTAKDLKLIDHPMGRDAMLTKLNLDEDSFVNISDYSSSQPKQAPDKIAVVYLNGQISPQVGGEFTGNSMISAAKVKKIIEDIRKDKGVKAVVLRINSPGGSALESEKIYQQLLKLKSDMPIVVSMGGVAASGGYYISCASDYIMADEATITGSIGVIMMVPETVGLGKKLGLSTQTLKHGKFAGAFNLFQTYDPVVLASLRRSSTATYDEFKARVISARKYQPGTIDSVAEGRVFSAAAAKKLRLIDEIGTLETAIAKAANLANTKNYSAINFPTKTTILEALKNSDIMKMRQAMRLATDPAAELERTLRQIPATGEWQYLLPYKLD
ncbi:MAG: signal peptide peptidase SppA [Candidatus Cloacimonetes bacterium HGW-Cloacimonetes-3]|jgi:protease-4|nr:MAG: signal peptide peptidase SppA [Candidatus Cloacimonetes bacterium HGW-Cloacimonetes-3]